MDSATAKTAAPVQVSGRDLRCQICDNDRFYQRQGQINTRGLTFFRLDWLNPAANCLICADCGYVHWFLLKKHTA